MDDINNVRRIDRMSIKVTPVSYIYRPLNNPNKKKPIEVRIVETKIIQQSSSIIDVRV